MCCVRGLGPRMGLIFLKSAVQGANSNHEKREIVPIYGKLTRTCTIPNGTRATATGLSRRACVRHMRSGEKGSCGQSKQKLE